MRDHQVGGPVAAREQKARRRGVVRQVEDEIGVVLLARDQDAVERLRVAAVAAPLGIDERDAAAVGMQPDVAGPPRGNGERVEPHPHRDDRERSRGGAALPLFGALHADHAVGEVTIDFTDVLLFADPQLLIAARQGEPQQQHRVEREAGDFEPHNPLGPHRLLDELREHERRHRGESAEHREKEQAERHGAETVGDHAASCGRPPKRR